MSKRNLYLKTIPVDEAVEKYTKAVRELIEVKREEIPVTESLGRVTSRAVSGGSADAGMGVYSAAKAMNLDFIEVGPEEYDFAVPVKYLELPHVQAFIETLKSEEFHRKLDEMGGYRYPRAGEIVEISSR